GEHALDRLAIGVTEILRKELGGDSRHIHDLSFERFPNALPASIDYGTNADFRKGADEGEWVASIHLNFLPFFIRLAAFLRVALRGFASCLLAISMADHLSIRLSLFRRWSNSF